MWRDWLKDKGKLREACTVMDDCGQKEYKDLGLPKIHSMRNSKRV